MRKRIKIFEKITSVAKVNLNIEVIKNVDSANNKRLNDVFLLTVIIPS